MSKIGGMFFDELIEEDIEFEFDKFIDPIVNEEKQKEKREKPTSVESENRKRDIYLDRPGNRTRFRGRK